MKNDIYIKLREAIFNMHKYGCHNIRCIMAPSTLEFIRHYCSYVINYNSQIYGTGYTLIGMDIDLDYVMMYGVVRLKDDVAKKQCMIVIDDTIVENRIRAINQIVDTRLFQDERDEVKIMGKEYDELIKINDSIWTNKVIKFIDGRSCLSNNREFMILPDRYIINEDACVLFDSYGNKTVVKRCKEDESDPIKAFLWAYFLKNCGMSRTKANKYLENIKINYETELKEK